MNSCVSCLTWSIAIPVLFVAWFVLGPWLLILAGVVVIIVLVLIRTDSPTSGPRGEMVRCPTCGRRFVPLGGTCDGGCFRRRGHW